MTLKFARTSLTVAAVAALGVTLGTVPASADTPATGSATAKAAYGSTVSITLAPPSGSGLLGDTVASIVQPIADALTYAIDSATATAVRGLLNSSGNTADTTTGPEYYPTGPLAKVALPGLLNIDLNGPNGHAWFDQSASAFKATSAFSSASIRALSLDLADVTSANAAATCPTSGSPSATTSLTDLALVSGLVDARLRNGSFDVSVDSGTTWTAVRDLHLTTVPGHSDLQIVSNNGLLQVRESIGVDRLLAALGLGGLFSGLPGQIDTHASNLTLSVTVGPGSVTAAGGNGIQAWGLEVGVDVSGTISVSQLSALGVLGGSAVITVPSGVDSSGHYGNLMDLKLAYATCTTGAAPPPVTRVPPGLI